ncbi:MAG TPA: ABC transporter ATP-binding protein [Acidimicrobiales bacterium]|nr:ABC transporter ATP-binding protein [Acidimicrobiales bacterium]
MNELAISAHGVGKRYRLGRIESGFKRARRLLSRDAGPGHIWALRDLTFEVPEGSATAIIGSNGAGKSTLLKILAKVTEPTSGYVDVAGRVGALLEVGTGFSPELTGRENVYLNGTLLGMTRREIDRRLDEIVAFSGVEQHLDKPIKWYSSGMYIRLGFAVAAHLEPDILIVDEVLAVGDLAFQQKCLGRMGEVAQGGRTVLFVSHNLAAVSALCQNAMYLRDGQIEARGPTREVISRYIDDVQANAHVDVRHRQDREGDGRLRFTEIRVASGSVRTGEDCEISVFYEGVRGPGTVRVALAVYGALVEPIFHCLNDVSGDTFDQVAAEGAFTCTIPRLPLAPGHYTISVFCEIDGAIADWVQHAAVLEVVEGDFFGTGRLPSESHGTVYVDHCWTSGSEAVMPTRLRETAL